MLRRRVEALQALVHGSRLGAAVPAVCTVVHAEYQYVLTIVHVPQLPRRYLLQVLHSTRALDTSLRQLASVLGRNVQKHSLGGYLRALRAQGPTGVGFDALEVRDFQQLIVDPRNDFMHRAGAFPSENEVNQLLSHMDACLQRAATF